VQLKLRPPLKATIAWTDPPGVGESDTNYNDPTPKLVNDLDLRLIDSNGITNYPYVLNADLTNRSASARAAAATTGDDSRNNVEQVCVTNPIAGDYTVLITHKGTLQSGSQWVSIILSGNSPTFSQQGACVINTLLQTSTNTMAIGWSSVVGQQYQIQYLASLGYSNNWQNLGAPVCARLTNVVMQIPYTNSVASTFYRIAALP
jgi:hypothetical protein